MTDQLSLYNGALRNCGETRLASLTEAREARYLLDDVWADGAVKYCLERGLWYFAMRTSSLEPDPDVAAAFGYACGFSKPDDWVRTAAICSDEYFENPITEYVDEAGYWWSDTNPLYVRYVSTGPQYGGNLGNWPETFSQFVQAHLANEIVLKVTSSRDRVATVQRDFKDKLLVARSMAAMNEAAAFPPPGSWARARRGANPMSDGGNRNRLIG